MARGKKAGPTRMDMRRQADAAEARGTDAEAAEVEVEDEEVEAEAEVEESDAEDDDGESPKKKKKPAKKVKAATVKKPAAKRVRTPKEVRQKAVWVVFDNSSKIVEKFAYGKKAEAEELLAKKIEEKKTTFYLNLVKEPID